jgi:acyl carrier protein
MKSVLHGDSRPIILYAIYLNQQWIAIFASHRWKVSLSKEQIYTQLTEIFRDIFDDEDIILTPEITASDIAGCDSFNHLNLIVATEMRFGIKFKTTGIESLGNVGHFVDVNASRVGLQINAGE